MRRLRAALQRSMLFPALSSFCRLTVLERELLRSLTGPAIFVSNRGHGRSAATPLPPSFGGRRGG